MPPAAKRSSRPSRASTARPGRRTVIERSEPRGHGDPANRPESDRPGGSRKGSPKPKGSAGKSAAWVRAVLDRPMTSYQLVLAAAGLLVTLGVLMVLSASSVAAYVDYSDSYWYFKRQIFFLVVGLIGVVVVVKLPRRALRVLGWVGLAGAVSLVDLDLHPAGGHVPGQSELARHRPDPAAALGVRQAGPGHLGCRRAGPQAEAARPAEASAGAVPAGRGPDHLADRVPGRCGHGGRGDRHGGRRAVDGRSADAGLRRAVPHRRGRPGRA